MVNRAWKSRIVLDTQIRVAATPLDFRLNIDTGLCLSAGTPANKFTIAIILIRRWLAPRPNFFCMAIGQQCLLKAVCFIWKRLSVPKSFVFHPLCIITSFQLEISSFDSQRWFSLFYWRCCVSDSADQWPSPQIALLVFDIFQIHSRHIICLKTVSSPRAGWWWWFQAYLFWWL